MARTTWIAAKPTACLALMLLLPRVAALPVPGRDGLAAPGWDTEDETKTATIYRPGASEDAVAEAVPTLEAAPGAAEGAVEAAARAAEATADDDADDDALMQANEAATEDAGDALVARSRVVAAEDADDEDMRGRMAYLILSLWDSGGLQGLDGSLYLPVEDDELVSAASDTVRGRRKRDMVFRPLWVTKMLHARRQQLRARYFNEYNRAQRVGRDVQATAEADKAAPYVGGPAGPLLSRQRRQWTFKPLFAARERTALGRRQARRRRLGRAAAPEAAQATETAEADDEAAEAVPAPPRPRSRRRREWVDVPMFAVKQIHAERIKEEEEITDPHRLRQQQQQPRYHDYRGSSRDFRDFRESRPYTDYRFRPYRDYYRYYG